MGQKVNPHGLRVGVIKDWDSRWYAREDKVGDLIRGKDVKTAAALLSQTTKAACEPMAKLLKSAVANAEHNHEMNADNLYVSTVIANPGPVLKRGRIASRRGFVRIMKRTTHITIGVSEKA